MSGVVAVLGGLGGCGARAFTRPRESDSFVAGTKVLLANGKRKPIEKLKVGDKIRSTDTRTGKPVTRTVTATFGGTHYDHLVQITVHIDGRRGHCISIIVATEHHLFWNQSTHAWIRADHIAPSTHLRTPDGGTIRVIHAYYAFTHPQVHDLTITGTHTFYVTTGSAATLVHNTGCDEFAADFQARNGGEIKTFGTQTARLI